MEDLLKRRYIEERVSGEDATRIFGNNMITNEERIEVLSKIEKIMAHTQTESGAVNVNEMAIANRLVKELMDKYEISIDEIKTTSDKSTLVKNIESELIDQKGIRHWVISLSSIVASFYECRIMRTSTKIFFIGFEMDAKVASKMFDHLYLQIYNAAIKATEIPTSISRKTRVIDFCVGALGALSNRLDEIKEERKYQESKNALVIVKKDIVEKQMDKMYPGSVSKTHKTTYHPSEDYRNGVQFGQKMEIHKSIK